METINDFYLIDVVMGYDGIKARVEIVEQIDYLERSADGRKFCKTNNVAEIYGDAIEAFSFNGVAPFQGFSDRSVNSNINKST